MSYTRHIDNYWSSVYLDPAEHGYFFHAGYDIPISITYYEPKVTDSEAWTLFLRKTGSESNLPSTAGYSSQFRNARKLFQQKYIAKLLAVYIEIRFVQGESHYYWVFEFNRRRGSRRRRSVLHVSIWVINKLSIIKESNH